MIVRIRENVVGFELDLDLEQLPTLQSRSIHEPPVKSRGPRELASSVELATAGGITPGSGGDRASVSRSYASESRNVDSPSPCA